MATFMSLHKELNFFDMAFHNGRYTTEDPKEIKILTCSPAAKRYNIVRIDNIQQALEEPKKEEPKEEVKVAVAPAPAKKVSPSVKKGASIKKK